jgi:hypothetical protein
LVPFFLEKPFTTQALIWAATPWGAPLLLGIRGHRPDAPDEAASLIVYEWPVETMASLGAPLPRRSIERLQVDRLNTDILASTGSAVFDHVADGDDPPDFIASRDRRQVGIELTRITVEERRSAYGLFRDVRSALLQVGPERLRHLAGNIIYMWFGDENDPLGLPHRERDVGRIEAIVDALVGYEVVPGRMLLPSGSLPEQAPDPGVDQGAFAANFYPAPMIGGVPNARFFARMGFEMGLGYTTALSASRVWNEIGRLVEAHDREGVDILVLSAGALDEMGTWYPSDAVAAEIALSSDRNLQAPTHIGQVWLHRWDSGEVRELFPTNQTIARETTVALDIPHRLKKQ